MLYTVLAVVLVLWLLGVLTSTTLGGLLHLLLVVAALILIVRFVAGRRVV